MIWSNDDISLWGTGLATGAVGLERAFSRYPTLTLPQDGFSASLRNFTVHCSVLHAFSFKGGPKFFKGGPNEKSPIQDLSTSSVFFRCREAKFFNWLRDVTISHVV